MGILILPVNAGLAINGNKLTDHKRSAISITPTRLENRKRMANGTMRNFIVAQKRKFKTSWEFLPYLDAKTVDGFWGAKSIIDFYNATFSEFTLRVNKGDGTHEDVLVMFDDFSFQLKKRTSFSDFYDVDVTFEEV